MFDFQRYKTLHPRLISNSQGLQQNLSLGKNPIDNAEPCYTHDNIVGSQMCDDCAKSNLQTVCHKLLSISWPVEQVRSLTIECQVYQFVPCTRITRQSESILPTILQLIQVPLSWNDDHPSKDLRLCVVAPLSVLQIHSTAQRIFEHALPCRRTQSSLREAFSTLVIFQLLQQKFVIRTFMLSASQVHVIKKWRWLVKINVFHQVLPHGSHIMLLSSHVYVIPDKKNPCFPWTNRHSQFGPFSNPSYSRTSSNCLSQRRPASGWPYNFRWRGTTGSSMFHVFTCLDFLILEFCAIWEQPPSLHECMLIRRRLIVRQSLVVLQWHSLQISLKRNDWIFHTGPWFGPFVSW